MNLETIRKIILYLKYLTFVLEREYDSAKRKAANRGGQKRKPDSDSSRLANGVNITPKIERDAIDAAYWITASPHEWEWTKAQQVAMAQYVLWAHQRLAAIGDLASVEFRLEHDEDFA